MKKFEQFFCYCSGASGSILKRCPSETSKYVGIGATIFFTGLLAAISFSYAMHFVFDGWILSILSGIIWGLMIFNLDRFIVLSMRKSFEGKKEILQAIPRIILAVLIAVVISKPLELKIFEKEIITELSFMKQELLAANEKAVVSRFNVKSDSLSAELDALKLSIQEKEKVRNELLDLARQEADGTGGSGKVNPGPIYQIKKKNADLAQLELNDLNHKSEQIEEKIYTELSLLEEQKDTELKKINIGALNGISFQLTALTRLGEKYSPVYFANLFIILLFIVLETTPILAKLIAPRGPYDDLLAVHEKHFESYRKEKMRKSDQRIEKLALSKING